MKLIRDIFSHLYRLRHARKLKQPEPKKPREQKSWCSAPVGTSRPLSTENYYRIPDGSIRRRNPKPWSNKAEMKRRKKIRREIRRGKQFDIEQFAAALGQ